jgi:hypothetical protein
MSDRATRWQQDFKTARGVAAQAQAELKRWELLSVSNSSQTRERTTQGAQIRVKVNELKRELERLKRELDGPGGLSAKATEHEVTRKSITQFRDEIAQALSEVQEMQQRAKGSSLGAGSFVSSGSTATSFENVSLSGSFTKLAGGDRRTASGAELQPVSQRSMLQQQQQAMRDMEAPLNVIEGSMNNLQQVSTMVRDEIRQQNNMLDSVNQDTERVQTRMERAGRMLRVFTRQDRNRWLMCSALLLLLVIIVLFVYVVGG